MEGFGVGLIAAKFISILSELIPGAPCWSILLLNPASHRSHIPSYHTHGNHAYSSIFWLKSHWAILGPYYPWYPPIGLLPCRAAYWTPYWPLAYLAPVPLILLPAQGLCSSLHPSHPSPPWSANISTVQCTLTTPTHPHLPCGINTTAWCTKHHTAAPFHPCKSCFLNLIATLPCKNPFCHPKTHKDLHYRGM